LSDLYNYYGKNLLGYSSNW